MADPKRAGSKPCVQEVEPGTYWWCACGHSESQPFCDGSHKGTGIAPVKHEVTEPSRVAWCLCKHTGAAPLCDGSHSEIQS